MRNYEPFPFEHDCFGNEGTEDLPFWKLEEINRFKYLPCDRNGKLKKPVVVDNSLSYLETDPVERALWRLMAEVNDLAAVLQKDAKQFDTTAQEDLRLTIAKLKSIADEIEKKS